FHDLVGRPPTRDMQIPPCALDACYRVRRQRGASRAPDGVGRHTDACLDGIISLRLWAHEEQCLRRPQTDCRWAARAAVLARPGYVEVRAMRAFASTDGDTPASRHVAYAMPLRSP